MQLKTGEKFVAYSDRVVELINELESTGHNISELEKEHSLLRSMPKQFDITAKTIMGRTYSCYKTFSR